MKQILVILSTLLLSSVAFSAEEQQKPIQVVCVAEAVKAAEALFALNNKTTEFTSTVELVDIAHVEEGGYEVYDVIFTSKGVQHSPYRVTTNIDACLVINFEMPFAG